MRSYLARTVMSAVVGLTLSAAHAQQTSTIVWDDEPTGTGSAAADTARTPALRPDATRVAPVTAPEGTSYANQWGVGGPPQDTAGAAGAGAPAAAESRNIYNDVGLVSEPSEIQYAPTSGRGVTTVPRRSRFEWAGEPREYQISRPGEDGRTTREVGGDDPFRPYVDPDPSSSEREATERINRRSDDSFRPFVDPE